MWAPEGDAGWGRGASRGLEEAGRHSVREDGEEGETGKEGK